MLNLTAENFSQEVLQSSTPTVVDFWAEWCGPCRAMAPVFEEASKEFEGKVKFAKLNVDEAKELAKSFGVMSIPTLILFVDGKAKETSIGLKTLDELIDFISNAI